MGIKKFKPTSPGVRTMTVLTNEELTKKKPERSLVEKKGNRAGRNNQGRITIWHRGGGHKRKYRLIDFRRTKKDIPARVAAIEYDPNRSARNADIKPGNALPIRQIPVGTMVHNVELKVGKGGQLARAAGSVVQILAKEGQYAHLRLRSGEVRLVSIDCMATVGQVGNVEHEKISLGKAGRSRWLGRRPTVRGVAMNPVDHPLGGGEGKASGGRHPCTPWGKPTKGHKTRKNRTSDAYIVKRRK